MKTSRWIKWIVAIAVIALLAAGVLRALSTRRQQQEAVAAATAARTQVVVELAASDTVSARPRELVQGIPLSGSLKAVNSAFVKARVAGELQGLAVREGDAVKVGQIIARIEPTEYEARLRQAQQQADSAKAQVDIAQRQWDNNKALVDQGFISKTALDNSMNSLTAAQATYKAAVAAVDVARKALEDAVLRAPITGIVSQRLAQPGERIAVDARVLEIVDLGRLELEATLAASESIGVRIGQQATLQVEGSTRSVAATVVRINPSTQAGSRSVLAYLALDDPTGLRQGLFAQGTLRTGQINALAVPLSAVRTDKPNPYVQTVENGKVAHPSLELGARGEFDGETLVAVKGIEAGAVVIKGSIGPLREGAPVRFTPPAAPSKAAPAAASAKP